MDFGLAGGVWSDRGGWTVAMDHRSRKGRSSKPGLTLDVTWLFRGGSNAGGIAGLGPSALRGQASKLGEMDSSGVFDRG